MYAFILTPAVEDMILIVPTLTKWDLHEGL